jgi:IS5 family transposase
VPVAGLTTATTRKLQWTRAAHIIVAAEVVNTSSDVQQLPMVLNAVKDHLGASPVQVLADAGYRSEAVMAELAITQPDTELVIALGREGKVLAKPAMHSVTHTRWHGRQVRNTTDKDRLSQAQVDC